MTMMTQKNSNKEGKPPVHINLIRGIYMKKTIMITTTTYRYIEVYVTDEDYFNDLVNDLNIQM